ncbi:peptidyl-tRNA hydrolase [Cryptococcus sp. DSM 104549]
MSSLRMDGILPSLLWSIVAFTVGYQAHSLLNRPAPALPATISAAPTSPTAKPKKSSASSPSVGSSASSSGASDTESDAEDAEAALVSDLTATKFSSREEMKLVLVVNDELKMSKGKIAAQAGHATLACALMLKEINARLFKAWQNQGQPKIALRCANTEELEILAAQARSLNLCARTIRDAGRTQVAPGSKTIVGIGPGPARLINQITGKLKLL